MNRLLFFGCLLTQPVFAQAPDSLTVEARVWSRDKNRQIVYSDWKPFRAMTVERLNGFRPVSSPKLSTYGGDASRTWRKTGFFRTENVDGRWWLVDPEGHPYISLAVNSVRPGQSPNNRKAFDESFGNPDRWIAQTKQVFNRAGFTEAGSWSEVDPIRQYNQTTPKPLVYSVMLSFLSTFERDWKTKHPNTELPPAPLLVFDSTFAQFCRDHARRADTYRTDPNVLGYFSDNEIAFTNSLLDQALKAPNTPAYRAASDWLTGRGSNLQALTDADREAFQGLVAGVYYRSVVPALKAIDPNHLYLGTRLHANAKYNPAIFAAAEPFIDVISINFYGQWQPTKASFLKWAAWSKKPFIITEFYTKGADTGMPNMSGAGWLVRTQADRAVHYQNFCLSLLQARNCVGWHWFRYQDNDPADLSADPSNNDSNKGLVDTRFVAYDALINGMKSLNDNRFELINYFDKTRK
ncbi:agarase [Rudanella paleaurantiibacter]|uniref:Agarase n=1 Tax=Rudanella paleaurantiibacter TaxID=2614655 RepID=A0A7J5TU87_9BACT|nr:agarase [Rudanella paleaurantiibacter]KAB7727363.1 agarase [Rudanella paleaurantiibacter]